MSWIFREETAILLFPPNLLFISFSVSSCCLSKACFLSPTHFLFLIYPCVSLSLSLLPLQSHLPPHLHTSLDSTFSFFDFVVSLLTGKKGGKKSFSLSSFATFFFSVCGTKLSQSWLQVLHFTVIVAKQYKFGENKQPLGRNVVVSFEILS